MPKIIIPRTAFNAAEKEVTDWTHVNLGSDPSYNDSMQATIDQWGLPWFRAGVLVHDALERILMVHEGRVQIKKIKDATLKDYYLNVEHRKPGEWVDGDGGWNLPAGRLTLGEDFEACALREAKEETGWDVKITDFLCSRHNEDPKNTYFMPVYLAQAVSGPSQFQTAETQETLEIGWFSIEGIRALNAAHILRSPEFVMDSIATYEQMLKS